MDAITIERIERALALAAYVVVLDGPIAAPLFNRLERELATARAAGDSVARAKALLESYIIGTVPNEEAASKAGGGQVAAPVCLPFYKTAGGRKAIA